jgi:enoyl-CoA hydratase
MGIWTANQAAFGLHHVGLNHNLRLHNMVVNPAGLDVIRREAKGEN